MISATPSSIKQRLNKAYRLIKPKRAAMEVFKGNLVQLLNRIDDKETEENVKGHLMDFLKNTFYNPDHLVATKGKTDFVLHTGKEAKTPAGVLFEVKRHSNKSDMVTKTNLNAKALHELILYYLRERLDGQNTDMRHLVITNIYEWFVFDAQDFERLFGKNTQLKKDYDAWKTGQKVSNNTDHFYKEIAKPFLDTLPEELPFTYFNLKDFEKALRNQNQKDDNQLIGLYKILSPVHLLKLPFTNDSNSLDKGFYSELLHLIGLEETKVGNKKLIQRKPPERRQEGALLENAILTIESEDRLRKLNPPSAYGATEEERLFTVALELCITWVNRILFLKLLEAQLIKYHRGGAGYKFLNYATIPQYDELNKLFFQVLARRPEQRTGAIQQKYGHVPYLNSSLFEPTELEDDIIRVNSLDDMTTLPLHPNTVLRDAKNKPVAQSLNALEYLLRFLDAYDFASEGREEIQEESKTLINAAVLGLIFEKINGYKDGSIYTPGFITMYMCRQAIRLAVVQKFNEAYNWQAQNFDDLKNYLADHKSAAKILEFNALLNSLHICDPAVGSGHFLVSALNELIAVKAELKLLADYKGVRLTEHDVSIENDELIVTDLHTQDIFEYTVSPAAQGKGLYIAPETQRVQQTLFHEKQTIIENCLFGVDINPNSVKICRLRLWIELLKNAYYLPHPKSLPNGEGLSSAPLSVGEGPGVGLSSPVCYASAAGLRDGFAQVSNQPELQTLPNIDINIKQGNSLLSRFGLDTDLSEALRGTKYSVAQYRSFVQEYKNSHNKDRKRELETIINHIKADFRTEIQRNDPKVKRLQKLTGELQVLTTQIPMFEPSAKEKKTRKQQQQKLEQDIAALSTGIDEIKSNAIYRNAFEWRFEFPEVLDNDGNFAGFDVVIGNPPYLRLRDDKTSIRNYFLKNYTSAENQLDLYHLFIERAKMIAHQESVISFIIPNTFLGNENCKNLRKFILENLKLYSIIDFKKQVFDDASVEVVIANFKLTGSNDNGSYIILDDNGFREVNKFSAEKFRENTNYNFTITLDAGLISVIDKINSKSQRVEDLFDVISGVKEYQIGKGTPKQTEIEVKGRVFNSNVKLDETYLPELRGKNILNYIVKWNNEYLSYGKWLAEPRQFYQFLGAKILIRQIPGSTKLVVAYTSDDFIVDQTAYVAKLKSKNDDYIKVVLALLNSKLVFWYFQNTNNEFDKLFPKIKTKEFKSLPLFKFENSLDQNDIIVLVTQILDLKKENPQADTASLERQIDQLVYQLYDLTPEEIALVEAS
ncbi:TaqI-like C-terminal specificity domain-containing protein [Rufibacter sp. LB8]|uniref:DUF7149 domain-containing protein n=1 Tax=Rufibacter sp. LB8 TaxID=2777781 RepID=UPI00178C7ABB|nr:TaqI-like C-terminal specificity domain-containing protein [Rufibacter sp. LB8]